MHRPTFIFMTLGVMALAGFAPPAEARPEVPEVFCDLYPESPHCMGYLPTCMMCHTAPPAWNDFGLAMLGTLTGSVADPDALNDSLLALGEVDTDGDGASDYEELLLGTFPADPLSAIPVFTENPGADNPDYNVSAYDAAFAYRRAKLTYCAESPSYEELQAFGALDIDAQRDEIDAVVDACLASDAWRDEVLPRLADTRIKPLYAIGKDGILPLADYEHDYRLFVHVLTDDRDARELLTAQYFVNAAGQEVDELGTGQSEQLLQPDKRAGMITTRFFLVINTQLAAMPRTTAAQVYRAYLGQDIARSEGLYAVENEPLDVDNVGVTLGECVHCHRTLDSLTYAFAHYEGQTGLGSGTFDANRPQRLLGLDDVDYNATLLGQPLSDPKLHGVTEFAQIAANSEAFRRNLVDMFWMQAIGRAPHPDELEGYRDIIASVEADGYSATKIIHRIVDTDAFGRP